MLNSAQLARGRRSGASTAGRFIPSHAPGWELRGRWWPGSGRAGARCGRLAGERRTPAERSPVNQMKVHEQQVGLARGGADEVALPYLGEEVLERWHGVSRGAARRPGLAAHTVRFQGGRYGWPVWVCRDRQHGVGDGRQPGARRPSVVVWNRTCQGAEEVDGVEVATTCRSSRKSAGW